MKKKVWKLSSMLLVCVLLFTVFNFAGKASGQEITIDGILAKDFLEVVNPQEPSSYESVKFLVENNPSYRTGWSGFYSVCNSSLAYNSDGTPKLDDFGKPISPWVEQNRRNTDDSGRDKIYNVADYRDQIVTKYGVEVYEKALASGKSLGYQSGTKKEIHSKNHHPLPCKGNGNEAESDKGFFYNNFDFYLTLTFTAAAEEVVKEGLRIEPSLRTVEVGQSTTYKLIHQDAAKKDTDVTQSATWSIGSGSIGKALGTKGSFEGLAVGSTSVKATYNGLSASATLNVIEAKAKPEVTIYGPTTVKAGDEFSLFASANVDGGTIDQYIWDHNGSSGGNPDKQNLNRLYYMTEGEKYVSVSVEDNFNQWAHDDHLIEVTPPTPVAAMNVGGTQKENRKVILRSSSSSPTYFPITESYFTIEPMDGQAIQSIKSVVGRVEGGKYVISNLDVNASIDLLFKEKGQYKFYHYVKNSYGLSDDTETIVTIAPDLPPVANFNMETKVYRDAEDDNNASITLSVPPGYDESKDNDLIKQRIWKYRYDSDNDGNYEEESWVILDQANKTSVVFKSKDVGRYEFSLEIVEDFGQPTILEFIVPSDYKRGNSDQKPLEEKILLIDNRAPTVSWGP